MAIDAISDSLNTPLPRISHYIAAVGALGAAAYGLVDASKGVMGGMSNAGIRFVKAAVMPLIAPVAAAATPVPIGLNTQDILKTLRANWLNGVAKADQKAVAKSLVRLTITPETAPSIRASGGCPRGWAVRTRRRPRTSSA